VPSKLRWRSAERRATITFRSRCPGEDGNGPGSMLGIAGTDFAANSVSAECHSLKSPGVAHEHASGCMFDTGHGTWACTGAQSDWPGAPGAVSNADQGFDEAGEYSGPMQYVGCDYRGRRSTILAPGPLTPTSSPAQDPNLLVSQQGPRWASCWTSTKARWPSTSMGAAVA
jgi:hypothetical protein